MPEKLPKLNRRRRYNRYGVEVTTKAETDREEPDHQFVNSNFNLCVHLLNNYERIKKALKCLEEEEDREAEMGPSGQATLDAFLSRSRKKARQEAATKKR